ncbi:MAG: aminotransferase class V-fold PLP-dependent enzyme [Anaerolineales bacterium]|jgi:glutamate/tyrosine decarboxylase-like PLP-dependent enzyme
MDTEEIKKAEETLDPGDWEAMRSLGHRMVDDVMDYMEHVREQPVWRHAPDEVKARFTASLPLDPQSPEDIYAEFLEYVFPYPIGNIHPRFWGWVWGTGTVMGAMADFLAGAMNTTGGDLDHHSGIHVETQVFNWLKEVMGFPPSASGLLTNGCTVANLIGLAVARNTKATYDLRKEGVRTGTEKMILYASQEIHNSVQKALELLGLGSEAIHRIPVNAEFRIELDVLQAAIDEDRAKGYRPFCVVGAAGTTNTGAFDDLNALADICEKEDLWFHVDGAFGAWVVLSPEVKDLAAGMERADSLAFDLHKWMYMQYSIGCVLVRHPEEHRQTFKLGADYLDSVGDGRGISGGGDLTWFTDYDYHLSRGFRSLKAWMSLKEHGLNKYGRLIQQNIDQAQTFAKMVEETPELELSAHVPLNVVCFRYIRDGLDEKALDAINQYIMVELQEQGIAVVSGTRIHGKYVLHLAHTNHRSRMEDFEVLLREVVKMGNVQ